MANRRPIGTQVMKKPKRKIRAKRYEIFKVDGKVMKVADVYAETFADAAFETMMFFKALGWEVKLSLHSK